MRKTLLLFDLDGTLLRSDKTISVRTLQEINRCRSMGILIGISTSRSEQNTLTFLKELDPDLLITSGGALVKKNGEYIHKACFSAEQTRNIIQTARQICGEDCEITIDTLDTHYWNYKMDPKSIDQSWGESTWTDFSDFDQESLKICVEIFDENNAHRMETELTDCDSLRFSDGCWYKYTKKGVNKERAIDEICKACGIGYENIVAFGDDYADIGMLQLAGVGVAMGNAIEEVKEAADVVIGSNDEDGIADFLVEQYPTTCNQQNYTIRRLVEDEIQEAMDLCWEVFLQYEAPEYPEEGIKVFRANLDDMERRRRLTYYGAFDQEILVGMLCMRAPQHIGGFFVKSEYHKRGIGRALFEVMKQDYEIQEFTVNSSPYAVKIYEHLGFKATDVEQVTDGLIFTPMKYKQ